MLKRCFDLLVATAGLAMLSPLLLLIAVWIRLDSPGPVFYRGLRVGRFGRPFRILKFRTMRLDADKMGPSSTAEDDPRITTVGRLIRAVKGDELPQLINVVLGNMSLVGPRPQVEWAVRLYTESERALLSVRPGITDYASLVFRDEGAILKGSVDPDKDYLERIAPHKIRLGLEYVNHHSLWVDIRIIVATVLAIAGVDPAWCLPANWRNGPGLSQTSA